jgi:hypothetical protein
VTANNNLATFDNTGSTAAVTYTLPSPLAGMTYTFLQSTSTGQSIFLSPTGSSVVIQASQFSNCATTTGTDPKLTTTSTNASITIQAISSTIWRALSCVGASWTKSM